MIHQNHKIVHRRSGPLGPFLTFAVLLTQTILWAGFVKDVSTWSS